MYQIPLHVFDTIDSRWRDDIFRFIDTGDASKEFLDFLDKNVECQNVVEVAFTLVSQDIAATARQLKNSRIADPLQNRESMTNTFARLFTHLLLTLVALDKEQRNEVLNSVGGWLPAQHRREVMSFVKHMSDPEVLLLSADEAHVS